MPLPEVRHDQPTSRLTAKYGAEITLDDLFKTLTGDCGLDNPRHQYQGRCRAWFIDLARISHIF
jgi:hypothetical protein